jgi:cell division protein FtsB
VPTPTPAVAARRVVRRRRLAVAVALTVVAAALLAVPMRSYLAQRGEIAAAEAKLAEAHRVNAGLEQRRERMDRPEEIERVARRDFGLVEVGQESYAILPPATAGLVLPRSWPFDRLGGALERRSTTS